MNKQGENKFIHKYIKYNRKECENKYNEIYLFLKDEMYIPPRLKYTDKESHKKILKKRGNFKKQVKKNFFIKDNLLYFKYKTSTDKENILNLRIPFESEAEIIINNIHIEYKHPGERKMRELIVAHGFYWEGYSKFIRHTISKCPICFSKNKRKKIQMPIKQIIDQGPLFRYQADLWYLDDDLKRNNNYEFILDVIEHFSKYLFSFLFTDKTSLLVLSKIKLLFLQFGKCKLFQTDNGKEFKNNDMKIYFENEGVKHIFSRPRHPQSNGCVESIHKSVRKYLLIELETQKEHFNIEIALSNFLIFYNKVKYIVNPLIFFLKYINNE